MTTTYANNAPHKPKLVLITGAPGGFGSAFARRFAAIGSRLVLAARRTDRLKALRDELKTDVHMVELDVRDRKAIEQAFGNLPMWPKRCSGAPPCPRISMSTGWRSCRRLRPSVPWRSIVTAEIITL